MRIIAHLDMDAFFAAIEERENPQFAGLGIVVGADPKNGTGRGVVSTANYQARKYGIHSAMPITTAWRLSEDARKSGEPKSVFLPVNMDYYGEVSQKIFDIIRSKIPIVEQTSVDEAYLDLSFCTIDYDSNESSLGSVYSSADVSNSPLVSTRGLKHGETHLRRTHLPANFTDASPPSRDSRSDGEAHFGMPSLPPPATKINNAYQKAAELIKEITVEIKQKEKLTAKVGIGPNKLIAKILTSLAKPDSVSIIYPQDVEGFLDTLSVRDIPGIGPKTQESLNRYKINTISDLKKISEGQLETWFGKWGREMYKKARGIDDSPLETERDIKSISEQETFSEDTRSAAILIEKIHALSTRVIERMQAEGKGKYKTVTLTVRFSDFTTRTRAHTLKNFASSGMVLKNEALKLFMPFLDTRENPGKRAIRLLGVGVENFGGGEKTSTRQTPPI